MYAKNSGTRYLWQWCFEFVVLNVQHFSSFSDFRMGRLWWLGVCQKHHLVVKRVKHRTFGHVFWMGNGMELLEDMQHASKAPHPIFVGTDRRTGGWVGTCFTLKSSPQRCGSGPAEIQPFTKDPQRKSNPYRILSMRNPPTEEASDYKVW